MAPHQEPPPGRLGRAPGRPQKRSFSWIAAEEEARRSELANTQKQLFENAPAGAAGAPRYDHMKADILGLRQHRHEGL